ncbi:CLUMA_CG014245, isoform A [Clunio marinus]|uniref:CLUMA_CG014245, isoform A n=1 Tax=Clunio marinus TaxID=568069 RepID=A0A1J1ILX7_9DIPT|nr:CLUMA_CG014245, isoform A [Clunio marinus]
MNPFAVAYILVVISCGLTHSYSVYGNKRFNHANVVDPMMPMYTKPSQQQAHYDRPTNVNYQSQYLPVPYVPPSQSRVVEDYNYNNNRNPVQSQNYYYYPRQDYQTPLYDSLHNRQQQLQKMQDLYNLKAFNDPEDYDIEQPNDWYDQTAILVDPNTFEGYKSDYDLMPQASQDQYQYQSRPSDYEDEVVKELKDLTKQNRKNSVGKDFISSPVSNSYNEFEWQQDMPQENDDSTEPEYDEDEWINWDQKRNIQPKKDYGLTDDKHEKQKNIKIETVTTPTSVTTEKSKLITKIHKGQKEVVLPRPATPVRKPFSEPIMKMMKSKSDADEKARKMEQTPPIYKTIKQIIDMEQNLNHLSSNEIPTSKIRKRFVTNEEALVQQLNGLKRTSK